MIVCLAAALFSFNAVQAQDAAIEDNELFKVGIEARFDYLNQALEGNHDVAGSGFKVRYFNLRMDGQITSKFSYSWRQRFNRANSLN
jgi:hypothetical protein